MFCFFFVFFLAATSSSIPPSVFWSAGPQKFPHPLAAGQVCLQRCVCIHAKCLQQWCITKRCITSYTCTILLGHDTKDRWWMVGAVLGVVFSNKSWILDVMHCGKKQLHISFNESHQFLQEAAPIQEQLRPPVYKDEVCHRAQLFVRLCSCTCCSMWMHAWGCSFCKFAFVFRMLGNL